MELERNLNTAHTENNFLKRRIEELRESEHNLRNEVVEKENSIMEMQNLIEDIGSKVTDCKKEIARYKKKVNSLQDRAVEREQVICCMTVHTQNNIHTSHHHYLLSHHHLTVDSELCHREHVHARGVV